MATDRAKAVMASINDSSDGPFPERQAIAAQTTNRNFLTATGEAAIGKDLAGFGDEAIKKAGGSASQFLLAHEGLVQGLVASGNRGLGWLNHLIGWLKRPPVVEPAAEADQALPITPVTVPFWTPGRVFRDIDKSWCPEMVAIPAGSFLMGSPEDEEGREEDEGPQHRVEVARPFALGRYPVTFDEFDHFCDETGRDMADDGGWGRGRRPVIYVSWEDAKTYCDWLSGVCTGAYRLPTEAEWEYACRAGTSTAYAFGGRITEQQANFGDRPGKTSEVGAYRRNAFSLFDMHGNVYEWCDDGLRDYTTDTVADPRGGDARQRVLRGGSWLDDAQVLRSACRNGNVPDFRLGDVGFRCARVQE